MTSDSTLQWSIYKGCSRISENIAIVGVMQKRSELSHVQKGMIIGFRDKVGIIFETANSVNSSYAAKVNIYHAWHNALLKTSDLVNVVHHGLWMARENNGCRDAFKRLDVHPLSN